MTLAEKLRLQIIRVQIRLNSLGLYNGQITGTLDQDTRTALKLFQKVKNLPESGQMTTPTLNALGIPAVK
jgi:His-Xaa-Ser repeat protein HxsA